MKHSELKKLIKEEIRSVLDENDKKIKLFPTKNRWGGITYQNSSRSVMDEYDTDVLANTTNNTDKTEYFIWHIDTPNTEELKQVNKQEFDKFIGQFNIDSK
jgi:hypothetical protein